MVVEEGCSDPLLEAAAGLIGLSLVDGFFELLIRVSLGGQVMYRPGNILGFFNQRLRDAGDDWALELGLN